MEFLCSFLRRHFEKLVVVSRNGGCFLRLIISLSPCCSCKYYLKIVEFKIKFSDFFLYFAADDGIWWKGRSCAILFWKGGGKMLIVMYLFGSCCSLMLLNIAGFGIFTCLGNTVWTFNQSLLTDKMAVWRRLLFIQFQACPSPTPPPIFCAFALFSLVKVQIIMIALGRARKFVQKPPLS